MGTFKYFKLFSFLFLSFSIVFLLMENAVAKDNTTLERLEKIIQQQQVRIQHQKRIFQEQV